MVDDSPHDRASPEIPSIFLPVAKTEEPIAGKAAHGIEAEFEPELELEPLPLRVCPFDLARYHPRTHILPAGGIRCFSDFVLGVPKDLLLRSRLLTFHPSPLRYELCFHAFMPFFTFISCIAFYLTVLLSLPYLIHLFFATGQVLCLQRV